MKTFLTLCFICIAVSLHALPRFILITGGSCSNCHINSNGGAMRNSYGATIFGREQLPLISTRATKFKFNPELAPGVSIGADIRTQYLNYDIAAVTGQLNDSINPRRIVESKSSGVQAMQASLYLNIDLTDDFSVNVKQDFLVPSGFEASALLKLFEKKAYVRAGVFQPGFGLRMDDHQIATRGGGASTGSGPISFNNGLFFGPHYKDIGVEIGGEYSEFTASLSMFSGRSEKSNIINAAPVLDTIFSYAYVGRLMYSPAASLLDGLVNYFVGASMYKHDTTQLAGGFLGVRVGPVNIIGEYDAAQSLPYNNFSGKHSSVTFAEATVNIIQGLDLQVRYEKFDKDVNIDDGTFERNVFGVILYPIPYVELIAQYRSSVTQNGSTEKLALLQTHFWF